MKIRKAYKFRLKAKPHQVQLFRQQAGCCRFVWNKALAFQKERLDNKKMVFRYAELCKLLTGWKREEKTVFLADAPVHALQQTLKSLDKALREAFDKKNPKRFPRLKKKGRDNDSFRHPDAFKIDDSRVFLPKIGWIRFIKSREIKGTPKNVTVSRRGEHWYVAIQTEIEIIDPVHPSGSSIGIDMGITRFATLSDGSFLKPLNSFKKLEKNLAREQRNLARKVKFSSNWQKQKKKITRLHIKITDTRNDFLHKASTRITNENQVVVIEDLKVSNMSRSVKGTMESPGKKVKAKSGLNKAILDQGWYEFRRQLEYKQKWKGGKVVAIPPQYTSQTCPSCGNISPENRKSQSRFACICGYRKNADHVAAINILAAGLAVSACGETAQPGRSMKQEPTEEVRYAA